MDQPTSIALLAANAVLLIALGAWLQLSQRGRQARLAHFIDRFREGASPWGLADGARREESPLVRRANLLLSRQEVVLRLRRDLVRAGLTIKPSQFFLLRVGLALAGVLLAYVFSLSLPFPVRLALLAGGAVGGYRVVKPYLRFMQRRRIAAFEKYFPDALDVMIGALESGASLTTAMELVSREMPPPLSLEFARVLRDAGMGLSYEDAFGNMLDRLPSEDLGMMVTAVSIQFRVGGNLAEIFKTLGHTVRERVRIRGEIKTLTSQQRLTGRVITGLPFFLTGVLFWLNRGYMVHLFDPGITRVMLVLGLVMIGIGNWVIGRIVAIEV